MVENVNSFMNTTGFLNFYIAALITGSILGMNRKLLLKAAVRFLPVAICAMTFAILAVGIVGAVTGYGFADAIMYVAIPMMGGGMGAGVVPLSGMYAEALGQDSAVLISRMIPASTLGNVSAIVGAGLLAKVGDMKPSLTGNGQLMRKSDDSMKETMDNKPDYVRIPRLLAGLQAGAALAVAGTLLQAVLNNAMASPNVIGVNSGAGFFALLAAVLAPEALGAAQFASFLGALGCAMLVYGLARLTGLSRTTLVLSGLAVSGMFSAGINIIRLLWPESVSSAPSFLVGGLSGVALKMLLLALPYLFTGGIWRSGSTRI